MLLTAIAYLVTDVTDNYSVPLFLNCCLTVYLVPGVIDKCRLSLFLVDCQLCSVPLFLVDGFHLIHSSLNRCCYCISADYELLSSDVDTNHNPFVLDSYVIHLVFQSPVAPSPVRLIQATVDGCDVGGDVHHA